MRMQGLYEAIKHGDFFPVVNMSFLGGFGYISNIFYSNLWLYPVAFLRLLGMTTVQAFISFYVLGNYGNFYAKLKKLTAQYHVGSDQQRMNELA